MQVTGLVCVDGQGGLPVRTAARTAAEAAANSHLDELWDQPPVIVEGKASMVLLTPQSLPASIKNRTVTLELDPGATVNDLVAVLGKLGLTIIVSDVDAAKKAFFLPHYKGTIGNLLSTITRATDVWFTWRDGAILVSSTEKIGVSVPQESNFGDQLGKGLDGLGIKERSVDWQSGMVVASVAPSEFRKVKTYLERYTANAAVVTLQMAVLNVNLKQDAKQGIDWNGLQVAGLTGGNLQQLQAWQKGAGSGIAPPTPGATTVATPTTTVPGGPTSGTTTGSSTVASAAAAVLPTAAVSALGIAQGALTAALFNQRFSLEGIFNFLQTYGDAETRQNVVLKTIAGNKVSFKSLTQIPYVSQIGVTTTGNTGSTSALGSTQTAKADDGIEVDMTPVYDAAANSVTIDFKLSLKAVVAFNELSAGNQLGTLTQPTTAERSFTDTLRLRPGQTVVVGGLTYDSISNNKGSPLFLQGTSLESQSLSVSRQSMFIVLRPTVMKLGQVLTSESGQELDLLPDGAEEHVSGEAKARGARKGAKK